MFSSHLINRPLYSALNPYSSKNLDDNEEKLMTIKSELTSSIDRILPTRFSYLECFNVRVIRTKNALAKLKVRLSESENCKEATNHLLRFHEKMNRHLMFANAEISEFLVESLSALNSGEKIEYKNGDVFRGIVLSGRLHFGEYVDGTDGSTYTGYFRNGLPHGEGERILLNGASYTGSWVRGKAQGKGVGVGANGDKYSGDWKRGKLHGNGLYIFHASQNVYSGQFKNGLHDGYGKLQTADNKCLCEGYWSKDGYGRKVEADGDEYSGLFKKGLKHGKGAYKNYQEGKISVGVWKKGHGQNTKERSYIMVIENPNNSEDTSC